MNIGADSSRVARDEWSGSQLVGGVLVFVTGFSSFSRGGVANPCERNRILLGLVVPYCGVRASPNGAF